MITHIKEEQKEKREKHSEKANRGGERDGIVKQDGGISNLGNTFFSNKKKRGQLKNEAKARDRRIVRK